MQTLHSPFQIELASGLGSFDTKKNGGQYEGLKVLDILTQEPTALPKEKAPWVIPSQYKEHDARSHAAQRINGKYWLLTADIDSGNHDIEVMKYCLIKLFGADQLMRIYSTGSAIPDNRKWRILIPLDKPLESHRWQFWQRSLNAWLLKSNIQADISLERCGQLVYLPNVPKSHRDKAGVPLFYQNELIGNDLLTESSSQAWADWLAYQTTIANEHEKAQEALKQERLAKPKRTDGKSVIEAFNRCYSVESLLATYGYTEGANGNWRSPNQTTKAFATKCFGDYWVSQSQSDASAGLGRTTTNGAVCGDAFDLYVFYEHNNDCTKAIKELINE